MTEKSMKNSHIIAILKSLHDEAGNALLSKHLPAKVLYAFRRSMPEIEAAYKAYDTALADICARYSVTPSSLANCEMDKQAQLSAEITELLEAETTVRIHTISPDALNACGEGGFDPLTFAEIDRLWWLIDDGEG